MDAVIKEWVENYLNEKYSKDFAEIEKLVIQALSAGIVEGVKEGKASARAEIINMIQGENK